MTVTYDDKSFLKLLFRWKGSVFKDIYKEYIVFILLYYVLNLSYRFGMEEPQQRQFERVVNYSHKWNKSIPIQFLIGFYVSTVFARWWQQVLHVARPDKFLVFISGNMQENDSETRLIRKTFARYLNLFCVLVWRRVSLKTKKRFPTIDHVHEAGLLSDAELELYNNADDAFGRWFLPVSWMNNLLARCKKEGRFSDYAHQKMMEELYAFRTTSAMLILFDWITIPLVYTQIVAISTYGYFLFCLLARQTLIPLADSADIDIYFPIFTSLEFIFFVGWLKVGEDLRCPFNDDDEDFDMNFILDRNMHVSQMIIDDLHVQNPAPSTLAHLFGNSPRPWDKDAFSRKGSVRLPYTNAAWRNHRVSYASRLDRLRLNDNAKKWHTEGEKKSKKEEKKAMLSKTNDNLDV